MFVLDMVTYMYEAKLDIWSNSVSNVKFANDLRLYIFCVICHAKHQVFGDSWLVWLAKIITDYLHIHHRRQVISVSSLF